MNMAKKVVLLVGTKKGLFVAESAAARKDWDIRGPFCDAWPVNHAAYDAKSGTIFATGLNAWYGPAIWKSTDLGQTWTHSSEGLTYGEGEDPIAAVWLIKPAGDVIYAGVEPAGLFKSLDGGDTWEHVRGLRDTPTRPHWQPGGGGLMVHTMEVDPRDPNHLYVGISVAGVLESRDGGATWEPRNEGIEFDAPAEVPGISNCAHHFELDKVNPDVMFQQSHSGMFISKDAGATWTRVEAGLPSSFGFPAVAHPRKSGSYFIAPLNGDQVGRYMPDASTAFYRTDDFGSTWRALRNGLPQENAYFGVLRQAMAADSFEPAGVYAGTSTGHLFASADEGESWSEMASYFPSISSVEAAVIDS
ncbi:MAG: exo-alpha-sialidase [bacterium]